MLEQISAKHRALYEKFRKKEGLFNGDYCFGNAFSWGGVFGTLVYLTDDFYISGASISKNRFMISYPLGGGDKKELIKKMLSFARENGKTPVLGMLNADLTEHAERLFGKEIRFERLRDSDDYIYRTEDLILLQGKEFHAKKNMLNSFLKNDFTYKKISAADFDEARAFCLAHSYTDNEAFVINRFFDNFDALNLSGACLKIEGKTVAVTVAERSGDTVIVHIEKAAKDIRGAYAAINNLYLKNEASDCLYVNREDDMGHENLRRAKMSYKPFRMEEKYIGIFL